MKVEDNEIKPCEIRGIKGFRIDVDWIITYKKTEFVEVQLTGDGCTQRGTTIYKESNTKYIKEIISLINSSIKKE